MRACVQRIREREACQGCCRIAPFVVSKQVLEDAGTGGPAACLAQAVQCNNTVEKLAIGRGETHAERERDVCVRERERRV